MKRLLSTGIMTGTSCDGADFACSEFLTTKSTVSKERLLYTKSYAFPQSLRIQLRAAQSGELSTKKLFEINLEYSSWLAQAALDFIKRFNVPKANHFFSVHGQTVWHCPPLKKADTGYSVQIFDPSHLALKTGSGVVYGFRQADLALQGQGAPFLPYYHWLHATSDRRFSSELPIAIHNIGGISNLTVVTKNSKQILAFDTGPGNALIDLAMEKYFKKSFDRSGKIAEQHLHLVDWKKIQKLAGHRYFLKTPPKSTGRELFNEAFLKSFKSSGGRLVAEATALTAFTMAQAYQKFVFKKYKDLNHIFIAGGGANNPVLLRLFVECMISFPKSPLHIQVLPSDFAPSQYLEAMGFARLGIEVLLGNVVSLSQITGAKRNAHGASVFLTESLRKALGFA